MDEIDLDALQNPDEWDYEGGEVYSGSEVPGAAFTLKFSSDEAAAILDCARRFGIPASQLLREAALEKVAALAQTAPR